MKRLTCEMCGSTDLIKEDGVFVCQSCGCKYSVEEARKMMVEGTVEVTGTVKLDQSNEAANKLENAVREYNNQQYERVIALCMDVLNADPENDRAVLYKALSDGWMAKGDLYTIERILREIGKARNGFREKCESDDAYLERAEEILSNSFRLVRGTLWDYSFQCNEYERTIKSIKSKLDVVGRQFDMGMREVGPMMFKLAQEQGFTQSDLDSKRLHIHLLAHYAIELCAETLRAASIIEPSEIIANLCGQYLDLRPKDWAQQKSIYSKENNDYLEKLVSDYSKISEAKKQQRIEAYWAAHAEEKAALDSKLASCDARGKALQDEIDRLVKQCEEIRKRKDEKLPETQAVDEIDRKISDMNLEMAGLGLFKRKEKKTLQDKIDAAYEERYKLQNQEIENAQARDNQIKAEIDALNEKLAALRAQIEENEKEQAEIREELTKDRK